MRLTLRTLLACLDRVLPPAEQSELDAKLAASTAAQQLASRIRRVVEQPGIPAPRLDGRGLAADANSVAEYLDNCLESERLETFERICLESDMHLAEVAACHDVLATLARDPAATEALDPAGRRKLLAALKHHVRDVREENGRQEAVENARAVHAALDAFSADETLETTERRATRSAWAAAAIALALLVVLGVFLVQAIGRGRPAGGAREPAIVRDAPRPAVDAVNAVDEGVEAVAAMPEAVAAAAAPVPPPPTPSPPPPQAVASSPTEVPATEAPRVEPVATSTAGPRGAEPAASVAPQAPQMPPPAGGPRVPQGDALAIAATTPNGVVSPPSPAPREAPADSVAAPESLGFVGPDGLLIHRVAGQGKPTWEAVAPEAPLGERDDLVAPFGSLPDIHVRDATIRLLPGTRAVIARDADGCPRLELVFGRAIIQASRPEARIGVTAAGLVGSVTAGPSSPVAVFVDLLRDPGDDPALQPPRVSAGVVAPNGGIAWRQRAAEGQGTLEGIAAEGVLEARTAVTWESVSPGDARAMRLDALPAWMAAPQQPDRLQRAASEAIAARVADTGAIDQALRELAADRRAENRIVAAATLSLLGEFDVAAELLCTETPGQRLEERQWSKLEADVVPLALARGENAAARLRQAFEDRGPPGKAEALFSMARGFSDDDLAAGAAEMLVESLDDPDLVVRRYAFKCLCDIVKPSATDRLRYRPDRLAELRREGLAWWRGQLQKGLIRRPGAA